MAIQVKDSNEYKKVVIENIVFLQNSDYTQYLDDAPDSDIDYLLNWYDSGKHETNIHDARDINTLFLGKLIKIEGYTGYFLFSKDSRIGYIGLSRIVEFIK